MAQLPGWFKTVIRSSPRELIVLALKAAGIAFVVFVIFLYASMEITSHPAFCGNACHIMSPYYESWKTSSHKGVPCVKCHMTPGIKGTLHAKMAGLSQLTKYFTGTAGSKPWAEVDDASCLRSGCHETRLLMGAVAFKVGHEATDTIIFDHTPHLEEARRGKKLRCTSCHSQVVQGEHLTVTTATCIICHFKNQPMGEPVAGCQGCHHIPSDTIVLPGGRQYHHKEVVDRKVKCVSCHASLTTGDGFVPRQRCFTCHNLPGMDKYLKDTEFLHYNHVELRKVECTDCHEQIIHGYESERRTAKLDCQACHENMHSATKALAEGSIASVLGDTQPHVGPMLAARVECISCHITLKGEHKDFVGQTHVGDAKACVSCHGEKSVKILGHWNAYFKKRIPEVEALLRSSRAPESSIALGRRLVDTVKYGKGVHNPSLGRDLLNAAERLANGKTARMAKPISSRESQAGGLDCSYCHLQEPERTITFKGFQFRHTPHTRNIEIECRQCHEISPAWLPEGGHGKVKITPEECRKCHHWQRERCQVCHQAGPSQNLEWNGFSFAHSAHSRRGVTCEKCHQGDGEKDAVGVTVTLKACAKCHHTVKNTSVCAKCHMKTLPETVTFRQAKLPHKKHVEMDMSCGDCHKPTDSGVIVKAACGDCHHDKDMKTPTCANCHGEGPKEPVAWRNTKVPHGKHIKDVGAECRDCHGVGADGVKIKSACATCHHDDGMSPKCQSCHGEKGPSEPVKTRFKPFPHPKHIDQDLTCSECHKPGKVKPADEACLTCHEPAELGVVPAPAAAPAEEAKP